MMIAMVTMIIIAVIISDNNEFEDFIEEILIKLKLAVNVGDDRDASMAVMMIVMVTMTMMMLKMVTMTMMMLKMVTMMMLTGNPPVTDC